jgi:hypothetical protein
VPQCRLKLWQLREALLGDERGDARAAATRGGGRTGARTRSSNGGPRLVRCGD